MTQAAAATIQAPDDIDVNLGAFTRSLRAEHKSERTIEAYREAVTQFDRYLLCRALILVGPVHLDGDRYQSRPDSGRYWSRAYL